MSYLATAQITASPGMRQRITACAATEGVENPYEWAMDRMWRFAAQPGWGDAYAYALASNPDTDPGLNEAVITDAMILAATQTIIAEDDTIGR